jgi:hypothetical protein
MRVLDALFLIAASVINTPATAQNDACFDDQQLLKLQTNSKQRGALVYVWSPRMVYSVRNAAIASRAAAAAGLEFVALHDMRVPGNELQEARMADQGTAAHRLDQIGKAQMDLATPPFVSPLEKSLPLCTTQLTARDALRHFPTAFVINAQGIHPHPIVGAMPWSAWVSSLDQRMKQP